VSPDREREGRPKPGGWGSAIVARVRRDVPLAILDLAIVFVAYLVPLVLRLEAAVPPRTWANFLRFIPVVGFLHLLTNFFFGLYGQMWRYASVQEARRVILAGILAGLAVVSATLLIGGRDRPLPLSVAIIGSALSLMGVGAIRFQSRLFGFRRRTLEAQPMRVLVVGAGDAGSMVLKDLLRNPSLALDPVGFVDDNPRKVGLSLHGVPVLGTGAAIPRLVERLRVDQVLLAIPSVKSEVVRHVASLCEEAGVTLRVLPSVRETVGGRITARDIRDLQIEDLLGRQQVQTDLEAVRGILNGRRVLVSGAGGSIGSEIVRQVITFEPSSLLLLDHDETHLHDLLTEIDGRSGAEMELADIRDQDRILSIFMNYRPEVVFHTAAHKHVDLLEGHPEEALRTNVIGTANVTDAAVATGVARFVLISTDKAVRPVSVMGASKWFAEQIVRCVPSGDCVFCAVRFGNVLGSRGSVIPTFFRQIAQGGPVTVTHPSMARYFMSVEEAVQLVLQAAALSKGGEVFTLDMGEPMNILELAKKVIRLSGLVPERDVKISFVGTRPGEKLVEDIIDPDEEPLPSGHPGILASRPPLPNPATLRRAIRELEALAAQGSHGELASRIKMLAGEHAQPLVARAKL
jgi:FlaA1/EpsC-like NDP-sugar epimerase